MERAKKLAEEEESDDPSKLETSPLLSQSNEDARGATAPAPSVSIHVPHQEAYSHLPIRNSFELGVHHKGGQGVRAGAEGERGGDAVHHSAREVKQLHKNR